MLSIKHYCIYIYCFTIVKVLKTTVSGLDIIQPQLHIMYAACQLYGLCNFCYSKIALTAKDFKEYLPHLDFIAIASAPDGDV